ncbi:MAG: DEAD/DEAH box helicase [Bryobacteraceae bacterium]
MLVEEQIAARQQRAGTAIRKIVQRPQDGLYGDYGVVSASGKPYRVAMRGPGVFDNYCSCPDFAVNTLGTCKHIESLLETIRTRAGRKFQSMQFRRLRASVSLRYGETLEVHVHLPARASNELREAIGEYCDVSGILRREHYPRFAQVLERLRELDDAIVVYSDVLEFIDRENEIRDGMALERALLGDMKKAKAAIEGNLKVTLFPYQLRGALFAGCRGRVVIADDMGLGKTIEAIAAAAWLRERRGIERVLVIAPASVKYQWQTEIQKFCGLPAQVIDGPLPQRNKLYEAPAFFTLASYELAIRDLDQMRALRPDLIILDEAQRIRNWSTSTARAVKQLKSRYAFVLTGTPLENKLEELYSVVEFVDGRRLGPAFRFVAEHVERTASGKVTGYRGLDRIRKQLEPILLRRTRAEVLTDLPPRTDQIFHVPMTDEQAAPYMEQQHIVAQLVAKWQRQKWISEMDMRRLTCALQNMRMLCDSTFLFDKETNFSPKLKEFREIIRELALEENRKVVVFSEYERMTRLAGEELKKLRIEFVSLHGGVPAQKRGALMEKFREDPACRVFFSTDAGGVGLNLQTASAVINFEPPWNPARLEQRIARVHRLGQTQPVQVIHLLTENSIEERVWEILRQKKAVFAGLFDGTADDINFEKMGRKSVLESVKEIFVETAPREAPQPAAIQPAAAPDEPQSAAADFFQAGLRWLEAMAKPEAATEALSRIVQTNLETKRPELRIPLPEGVTTDRLAETLGTLVSALFKPAARAAGRQ